MTQLKSFFELAMRSDKKLLNLKVPVKGKKGISKFMRKKAIGQAKDDLNSSVQSADKKPEKYIKPDGKVGVRMVKTDKEVVKKEEIDVDEALTLQQRIKRGRLMKRMKARIKIGRDRAKRKMANKKTLEKRAMRQARNQLAQKLTRGIPKRELTFARKKEIEKRLEKPALQQRIKRMAKRLFKDVRKK